VPSAEVYVLMATFPPHVARVPKKDTVTLSCITIE
jgi:hypothetical protein